MFSENMASAPLIAVLSVFGIIFLIGVIAVVVAVILHCMKSFDVCQNFNTVTNNTQVKNIIFTLKSTLL